MALFATHIQFAKDLKDFLQVKNMEMFLSGTIYPDSRYVTGITREQTHHDGLLIPEFYMKDDFTKGWALHFMCDASQHDAFFRRFPEEFVTIPILQWSKEWYTKTALKILQDIAIVGSGFDANDLSYLSPELRAYDEPKEKVKHFYQLIGTIYSTREIDVSHYLEFFVGLVDNEEIITKLRNTIDILLPRTSQKMMLEMYDEMLEDTKLLLLNNTK